MIIVFIFETATFSFPLFKLPFIVFSIARDARWGRIAEGSGEDPWWGGKIAAAMVRGYQGDDLTKENTILSCLKHFALYGASEAGRDYNTVDMSRIKMFNEYFPPYKAAVEAGCATVMSSFNLVEAIPATGNRWLLTDLLRDQWGFDGFVVSDYNSIGEMTNHGLGDTQTVSALALHAGLDMDMMTNGYITTLKRSLEEGRVSQADIDQACRRVLEAKYKLGLFEDPRTPYEVGYPLVEELVPDMEYAGKKILIVQQQVMAGSIREELQKRGADGEITVASWFSMEKDLLEEGDVPLKDEEDYMDLVEKGRYDVIFADPCMKRMAKTFSGVFVDAVHFAVSGKCR